MAIPLSPRFDLCGGGVKYASNCAVSIVHEVSDAAPPLMPQVLDFNPLVVRKYADQHDPVRSCRPITCSRAARQTSIRDAGHRESISQVRTRPPPSRRGVLVSGRFGTPCRNRKAFWGKRAFQSSRPYCPEIRAMWSRCFAIVVVQHSAKSCTTVDRVVAS
jgi:hypothetical protein